MYRYFPLVFVLMALTNCSDDAPPASNNTLDLGVGDQTKRADGDQKDLALDTEDRGADVALEPPGIRGEAYSFSPPACGSGSYTFETLLAGPNEMGEADKTLAAAARKRDRQFHAINAFGTGGNSDLSIAPEKTSQRMAIRNFIENADTWDFESQSGLQLPSFVDHFGKVTGAYAGVGIAADAFRYATLRDQGADCVEVDIARGHLLAGLDILHKATHITGVPGVIVRALALKNLPHSEDRTTTPLFNMDGDPLPEEKNNGTWREDQSGELSEWVWEDSCSRDQLVGWALGMVSAWEVIENDDTIDATLKTQLQEDATAIAKSLMKVGEKGYDLEIHDADGRLTFHALLNEHNADRIYIASLRNGHSAMMALGIIGAFSEISSDPSVDAFLALLLSEERDLPKIAVDTIGFIAMGSGTNFSNYNMGFTGAWMASRYIHDDAARKTIREAITVEMYNNPDRPNQPVEQSWSFYDLVYVASRAFAESNRTLNRDVDLEAWSRARLTLDTFPAAPAFSEAIENCDAEEIAAKDCTAVDGTKIPVLGFVGRNGALISKDPVPMRIRAGDNFYWRTTPYGGINGSDDSSLFPSNDFRFVYWAARFLRLKK